jgi:hypothetical protein
LKEHHHSQKLEEKEMNIVKVTDNNTKTFNEIQIGALFEYNGITYMKICTLLVDVRGLCNSINLLDNLAYFFGPTSQVTEVRHELRILS